MSSASPSLGIEYLVANQASPEITVNEALNLLDASISLTVLGSASSAPGSPSSGDRYIITGSPTSGDAWFGQGGKLAYYVTGNGWQFLAPKEGFLVWDQSTSPKTLKVYTSSAWTTLISSSSSSLPTRTDFFIDFDTPNTAVGGLTFANDASEIFGTTFFQSTPNNGDTITIPFLVQAGTYYFTLTGDTGFNRGKLDISFDGTSLETGVDFYTSSIGYNFRHTTPSFVASGGQHSIVITVNGKNASSSSYYFSLTKVCIHP